MRNSRIFFHVGLGKVASTYLQQSFFPNLKGIQYIPPQQFRKASKIITSSTADRFLVSREFDRQMESELKSFCEIFPNTYVIICLRRHDEWIASHYRRVVKNGWYHSFDAFYDLERDCGVWKKSDLKYVEKIKNIVSITGKSPLIVSYDELLQVPFRVFDSIAEFTQTTYNPAHISLKRIHLSFSDSQLLYLQDFNRQYIRHFPRQPINRLENWSVFRPWWAFYHLILYMVAILPKHKGTLIDPEKLRQIEAENSKDWKEVVKLTGSDTAI